MNSARVQPQAASRPATRRSALPGLRRGQRLPGPASLRSSAGYQSLLRRGPSRRLPKASYLHPEAQRLPASARLPGGTGSIASQGARHPESSNWRSGTTIRSCAAGGGHNPRETTAGLPGQAAERAHRIRYPRCRPVRQSLTLAVAPNSRPEPRRTRGRSSASSLTSCQGISVCGCDRWRFQLAAHQ
jgi:hypothetical protein